MHLFFVLSGYLITSLLLVELRATGGVSLRRFYARRALRIMPAYVVCLGVLWLVYGAGVGRPGEFLSAATYTSNYYVALHDTATNPLMHLWSLATEEQFYLLWPAALLVLWPKRVVLGLVMILTAVTTWRVFLLADSPAHWTYVLRAFDTRCDMLAAGCFLAARWPKGLPKLRPWVAPLAVALLVLSWFVNPPRALYFTVEAALGVVLLLAAAPSRGWLTHPVLRWIGAVSYSLYLYHFLAHGFAGGNPLLAVMLALMLAATSYYLIERPALRWRDRQL